MSQVWIVSSVLGILAALFLAGMLLISGISDAEEDARQQARVTNRMLDATSALTVALLDAETGQRGFLLTGEAAYLDPFRDARGRVDAALADFRSLAEIDPNREQLVGYHARLTDLARGKFAELNETIARLDTGDRPGAMDLVRSHLGSALTHDLRGLITRIATEEQMALDLAYGQVDTAQHRATRLLGLMTAAVLACFLGAAFLVRRAARAEAKAAYLAVVTAERDRADLISHELSHRLKNLFAVIMSIITTTGRSETDPREAARKTRERVQAIARAHALSTGQNNLREVHLADLIREVAGAYAPQKGGFDIAGPDLLLPARLTTPLGLIVNELATNALKYGAWSVAAGTVAVSWSLENQTLSLLWRETGGPPPAETPQPSGFGTRMIELSASQADAAVTRKWNRDGLELELRIRWLDSTGPANGQM